MDGEAEGRVSGHERVKERALEVDTRFASHATIS